MTSGFDLRRLTYAAGWLLAWATGLALVPAHAQSRLSDWLADHPELHITTDTLHWHSWAQRMVQSPVRDAAREAVEELHPRWRDWFMRLNTTGRLTLTLTDVSALRAAPREDPVLQARDEVHWFAPSQHVAVLPSDRAPCLVLHVSLANAQDYLRACGLTEDVPRLWWVQPDGQVGVADTASLPHIALRPGAWLWVPGRSHGLVDAASFNIARFLSTQAPLEAMAVQPRELRRLNAPSGVDGHVPVRIQARLGGHDPVKGAGWREVKRDISGRDATLMVEVDDDVVNEADVDEVVQLAHASLPVEVSRVVVQLQRRGLGLKRFEVDRAEWALQHGAALAPSLRLPYMVETAPSLAVTAADSGEVRWQVRPVVELNMGTDSSVTSLGAQWNGEVGLTTNTWISGGLRLVASATRTARASADSGWPSVRDGAPQYATASALTLPRLQLTRTDDWGWGWASSVHAGYLEPMYAGVGGEVLYRPYDQRLAWGLEFSSVRQRAFEPGLGLRANAVNTGHLTGYWDGGDVKARWSMGRYLAGDWGSTLTLNHRFDNGVSLSGWVSRTRMHSAALSATTGGLAVHIPFEVSGAPSTGGANLTWRNGETNAGARLQRANPLYALTSLRWAPSNVRHAGDENTRVSMPPKTGAMEMVWRGLDSARTGLGEVPASTWAWAVGAVVISSRLDAATDRWASSRSSSLWTAGERVGNWLPVVLSAGVGTLAMLDGVPGGLEQTASTALAAGLSTVAFNTGLRFVAGRQRPQDEMGPEAFDGFQGRAFQSVVASNRTGLAFALVTPFAQNYGMPWLYGLAALTGLSRLQAREDWLSDGVAQGLMGFGMASLINHKTSTTSKSWRWRVGMNHIGATYTYR